MDITIHNCHTHLFTMEHVPKKFCGGLAPIFYKYGLYRPVEFILKYLNPFTDKDILDRISKYLRIGFNTTQKIIFLKYLKNYYPSNTKFIVLPMDMEYMGYGKPAEDINKQLEELANLRDEYPNNIIPFVHLDPRREDILDKIKYWIEQRNFKGIKIYPPLGYELLYKNLVEQVYLYCSDKNIPVITHCSEATIRCRSLRFDKSMATSLASPKYVQHILNTYPKLKLCLAHFGGLKAWEDYLKTNTGWLRDILDLMKSGKYKNLYTDISFTIFNFKENSKILKVLLSDPNIRSQVLYGTDFYMSVTEKTPEKKLALQLRYDLGEDLFRDIAERNPVQFLG